MGIFSNDNGKKLKKEVNEEVNLIEVKDNQNSICLISKETLVKGTIETSSLIQIEGTLEGDINANSLIHVGKTGKIIGNIFADSILVDGTISGEVIANRIEIGSTGKVVANISSKIFVIHEGGIFEGTKKTKEEEKIELKDIYEEVYSDIKTL